MKTCKIIFIIWAFLLFIPASAQATIIINEILADPPSGLAGDANKDGVTSSSRDEFVEFFNPGVHPVDMSGWYLSDKTKLRHVFDSGTIFQPSSIWVVFGGGEPSLPGISWLTASTGSLSLNNSGDIVSLYNSSDVLMDQVQYGSDGGKNMSLTRQPEGSGAAFGLHSQLPQAAERPYSAGYFTVPIQEPNNAVVPEPSSLVLLGLGAILIIVRRTAFKFGV